MVTHERAALFGEIVGGEMRLNALGQMAQACWEEIPSHFAQVDIDAFVLMPNHMHGVLLIVGATNGATESRATESVAPTTTQPAGPRRGSVGAVVGQFKSAVTKRCRPLLNQPETPIWQRNYHERIIRNERELNAVRRYIVDNPARWADDNENP